MTNTLSYTDLVPERDRFELQNGEYIEFMGMSDLDAVEMAEAMQIQKRIKDINTNDLDVESAKALNQAMADLILIILPDIPKANLDKLKTGQRLMIVDFWSKNNRVESKNGKSQAGSS